ncbi:phosphoenolpyruvate--protein phosphotransferase [Ornithinimicrobium sp. CNJ-824]|uniref:phosphoenolpyruvate--protein phosphotransferase n=1 Tax=Ornithinimicrobium sp. CNJ-824 TaxID=1904966 RepID=UPI001EDA97E9|nr:phosphoenolpyruvate--protein phosphotransferase [Ornithinimicrobium sp. CNJ-824]
MRPAVVSLVVVSHSRALAEAAVGLATQMLHGPTRPHVEVAAGLEDGGLGTDAGAVARAVSRADALGGGAGVLVLVDLGSAVLSAEMALELLDPEVAARVRLSPAPLVEGLLAAVVTAAGGADLDTCAREADAGLRAKDEHLRDPRGGVASAPAEASETGATTPPASSLELAVTAEHGLHARPAARLVACAAGRAPRTTLRLRNLTAGRGPVDGLSLSAVATLDAQQGHVLLAEAVGPEAEQLLAELEELALMGFGDLPGPAEPLAEVDVPAPAVSTEPGVAGSGLEAAIGPAVRVESVLETADDHAGSVPEEHQRLADAVAGVRARLGELAEQARRHLGQGEAEVFEAHATLLQDPRITEAAHARIEAGEPAAEAWSAAVRAAAEAFATLADPYQRERGQDVHGVGDRVVRMLLGLEEPESTAHGVLVVDELDPALAISLDASKVQGVLTRNGGTTGHGVLIATARGVPVLTGVGDRADVPDGTVVAFDARSGDLVVDPEPALREAFEEMVSARSRERGRALRHARSPAVTTDGVRVRVKANVSSLAVARLGADLGAEGSGLVRTEAVFAQWRQAPSVDQQVEVYAAMAAVYHPHPVTIRTWDVGGDKPLPFHPVPVEGNPFLGARGLRAFVEDPSLLLDQLQAVCTVAVDHPLAVLFPMITTVQDVRWARELLATAARRAGLSAPPPGLQVGIMVEVPAAALGIAHLAQGLDLVSIGSNDLVQYTLAAERGNPRLAAWSDALDPAVLSLVRSVTDGVPEGVRVGLCGAMAGDPDLAGLLVGLGVQELSASAASVPLVKQRLRTGSTAEFGDLAARALACPDGASVRALVQEAQPTPTVRLSGPRAVGTAR